MTVAGGVPSLAAAALLANLRTVVVRPATPENVGMIARSLRCMGITQNLTLLSPQFDLVLDGRQSSLRTKNNYDVVTANPNRINARAKKTASGAVDVLKCAQVVDSWEGATADCSLVIGASSRPLVEKLGDTVAGVKDEAVRVDHDSINQKKPVYTPRGCIDMVLQNDMLGRKESVAVVFGPEHGGLSDEELQKCDAYLCIPSDPAFPSLNLAMAVQIWAYEVRLATIDVGCG